MKILKNNINLYDTLFSGQCFRMTRENDNSYTVILSDRVINIREDDKYLYIDSNNLNNLEEVVNNYLDMNRDYKSINSYLCSKSNLIKDNINLLDGYHILRQDKFEMLVSYIISQNNRVNNISKSINLLANKFGKKVTYKNKDYYLFPRFEDIKDISLEDLKDIKLGFRDKYIINALSALKEEDLFNKISKLNGEEAINELTKIKGIGLKVASCILMFGFSKFDVYPLDTWARKYICDKYKVKDNLNLIKNIMKEEFGEFSGLAIQYFFHINRNKTN